MELHGRHVLGPVPGQVVRRVDGFVEHARQIRAFRFFLAARDPGSHERTPADVGLVDKEDAGPRDRGRGSLA